MHNKYVDSESLGHRVEFVHWFVCAGHVLMCQLYFSLTGRDKCVCVAR